MEGGPAVGGGRIGVGGGGGGGGEVALGSGVEFFWGLRVIWGYGAGDDGIRVSD